MNAIKAITILVILFMSLLLFAQENTSTMSADLEEAKKTSDRYHIVLSLSGSSNLYKENSLDREASTDLDMIPSVYLGQGFSLSGRAIVSKEETGARETSVSNAKVTLKKEGPKLGRDWATAFGVTGTAPTNELTRKQDRFQGGGGASANIKGQLRKVEISYTLGFNQNSHEFTTNALGDANIQRTLTNELVLSYEFIKNWSLGISGYYRQGYTYSGFERQNYGNEIALGYTVAKNWEISAGIGNEGGAFKANGTESNIKVYDQNTTVVQAAVTFTN